MQKDKKLVPKNVSLEKMINQISSNPDFLDELAKIHRDKLITNNREKDNKKS